MTLSKEKPTRSVRFWLKIALLVAYVGAGGFILYTLITSGVVPTLYLIAYGALFLLLGFLVKCLLFRSFKRFLKTARTFAVIIALVFAGVSLFGVYMLNSTLGALDSISKDGVKIETNKTFNIYISGIDTYGDIATQSRSDVNILATVNPDTRKVLLTTVPRDSYVPIALGGNDQKDKLTHAGNYGVESSMKTIGNLLDVDVDAYVRINFTSFIQGIDKLGGITVYNPTAFSIDGYDFPVGQVALDGKRALAFSRERKSLEGGDNDRGKNQQRVIEGVIQKITSIRTIDGFNNVLDILDDSVQTNISGQTMRALINKQVAQPSPSWKTESIALEGKGQTGGLPSYAMPNAQLYMYVLNDESLQSAQRRIVEVSQETK